METKITPSMVKPMLALFIYKPTANRIAGAPTIKAEILRKFGENVQGNLFNPERLTFRLQETFIDFEGFPNLGGKNSRKQTAVNNLHYMTVHVAVNYALDVVEKKKKRKSTMMLLVTGNGIPSVYGVAAIKNAILRDLEWLGYYKAVKDRNPGVVFVKFK
ncbi:hypothetical protein CRE_03364 [Caenorhabditis remanei]|uniref:Smr domain-containing protein n=1 Tax=Caenorhabditis remanei TaxID=31234 RepID=E3N653_CAERE|nr:hypothetical protein CRE_03364 [Caenorhabditis remanei]